MADLSITTENQKYAVIPNGTVVILNEAIELPSGLGSGFVYPATFRSDEKDWGSFVCFNSALQYSYVGSAGGLTAFYENQWIKEEYRTVTFLEDYIGEESGGLIEWLLVNSNLTEKELVFIDNDTEPEEEKSEIELVNEFKARYDYMSIEELEGIYNQAVNTYLDLAFPFNYNITEIPEDRPRAIYWIKDCMKEIIDRNGITATSYSENGLSYTWGTDMVSDILRSRVIGLAVVRGGKK